MQLDLFRRPVEPEDVEADVRRQILILPPAVPDYPPRDPSDPAWLRYGLGPVQELPRRALDDLRGQDRIEP